MDEPMELKVRTATGKQFLVDYCVTSVHGLDRLLYIEFIGYSMTEIFQVFSDANETIMMYGLVNDVVAKTYEDYTRLEEIFIVPDSLNHVRIRLSQEVQIDALGQ